MATSITSIIPVTPIFSLSPISAFDSRNVLVPLPINNPEVQKALEENGGNAGTNENLFESELNKNLDVVVPLPETNPEVQAVLEENGGNTIEDGIDAEESEAVNDVNADNTSNINDPVREFLNNRVRENEDIIFNNDVVSPIDNVVTNRTSLLSLEDREAIEAVPSNSPITAPANTQAVNLQSNSFNIYSYIINALQGGANEYQPVSELDNHVEFEV